MNHYEVALGALLHDVGKFSQRANAHKQGLSTQSLRMEAMLCPGPDSYTHVLYTSEFAEQYLPAGIEGVAPSTVANLASYHHRPATPEQQLIQEADRLSSGMERLADPESGPGGFRATRLRAITAGVALDPDGAGMVGEIDLAVQSPGAAFPRSGKQAEELTAAYRKLWDPFIEEWKGCRCKAPLDYINRALSILERYTWCIPSATNALPDISLYDHLKTTAAIAVCLHLGRESREEPFLLAAGDLSGIQRYIFELHQGAGGQARRLRARSFEIAAFSESISLGILARLDLSLCHAVLTAGGGFQLLLPNTPETVSCLRGVQEQAARWLHQRSGGETHLALAWRSCSREDLRDFARLRTSLNQQVRNVRNRAGAEVLQSAGAWDEPAFALPALRLGPGEGLCESCRKRAGPLRAVREGQKHICRLCEDQGETGRRLPAARYVAFHDEAAAHPCPLGGFELLRDGERPSARPRLLLDLEGGPNAPGDLPVARAFRARHVPRGADNQVLQFDEIAARAQGRKALGWLKMDVDNLGLIFQRGLQGPEADRTSISRVATLSRTLDLFFAGHVEEVLRTRFPDVYLVYSGGDDLLAVGPWNLMLDLAAALREDFRRYTLANPAWTLSAGLALSNCKTPVLTAVEWAERLLEISKHAPGRDVLPLPVPDSATGPPSKDRLTAFGVSLPWDRVPDALAQARRLHEWICTKRLGAGQVYRLMDYAVMYQEFQRTRRTACLQYAPLLARDIRRNWKKDSPEALWAGEMVSPVSENIKTLRFVCEYALNAVRAKQPDEE